MPIEANPDVPEVTPQVEAPATSDTGEIASDTQESPDWQAQYEKLRPEADRRASILSAIEGRDGPEAQARALAQYAQIELQNDEPESVIDDDFFNEPDPGEEVAQLRQQYEADKAAMQQERYDAEEQQYLEQSVEALESQSNVQLTQEEYELVINYAVNHRDQHNDAPDVVGGFNALQSAQQAANKRYLQSKNSVQVPTGSTGEPKIDYRDKDSRLKVAKAVFAAEMARQSQNQ